MMKFVFSVRSVVVFVVTTTTILSTSVFGTTAAVPYDELEFIAATATEEGGSDSNVQQKKDELKQQQDKGSEYHYRSLQLVNGTNTTLQLAAPDSIRYGSRVNGTTTTTLQQLLPSSTTTKCQNEFGNNPCGPDGICINRNGTGTGYICLSSMEDGIFNDCASGCGPNTYCQQVSVQRKMCLCQNGYVRYHVQLPCVLIPVKTNTTTTTTRTMASYQPNIMSYDNFIKVSSSSSTSNIFQRQGE